jgi:acetyltransferase-like isoleucine patch superfamily enzyme
MLNLEEDVMFRTNLNAVIFVPLFLILLLLPLFLLGFLLEIIFDFILVYKILIPLVIFLFIILYIIIFLLEAFFIFRLLKGKDIEGTYDMSKISSEAVTWGMSYMLLRMCQKLLDFVFLPEEISKLITLKIAGADIGKNCLITGDIPDPLLVKLGNNCIIGGWSMILCHSIEGDKLILKKTELKDNVTIGGGCIVCLGAVIEENTILGYKSFVKKNQRLTKNSIYYGTPAKKIESIKPKKTYSNY